VSLVSEYSALEPSLIFRFGGLQRKWRANREPSGTLITLELKRPLDLYAPSRS